MKRASVIGSGPNGLAAAVTLARHGVAVEVFESQPQPGGAARTMELTLPDFHHDFGSAVHPMGAASPFFRSLPLESHGLEWVHGEAPLAHVLHDGTAVLLHRDLEATCKALGRDGAAWRDLLAPINNHWEQFLEDALQPPIRVPHHPLQMARFGLSGFLPATTLAKRFRTPQAKALFAGLAAHSGLAFSRPLTSATALVLAAAGHTVGWPIPRGGAQAITNALLTCLEEHGGKLHLDAPITNLSQAGWPGALIVGDLTPAQMTAIAREHVDPSFARAASRFRFGPGAFKVDYALSDPIPWRAPECRQAITVHVGGTFEEIAQAEAEVANGRPAARPFLLLAQPTLFDPTRAPAGKHVAWVYCHVPNGSSTNALPSIEAQLERFAPGFRDCVLARSISTPARLQSLDANLVGGDVGGGDLSLRQFFLRPTLRTYRTGTRNLYICSASTPPGGGVHGMCGHNGAVRALRDCHW